MIECKVARLLSENEIVLNKGREHGVKEDMEFVIYSEGEHIFDTETGEDLGPIETIKSRVIVTHTMEKMSRAETSTYEVNRYDFDDWGEAKETIHHKLKVKSSDVKPIEEDLIVRVGDKVRSV